MADLFVTILSIVPKPTVLVTPGPASDNGARSNNGTFSSIQNQQVMTPGKPGGK